MNRKKIPCILLLLSPLFGWFSRMDGGAPIKTPELVERILCFIPYLITCFLMTPYAALCAAPGLFGRALGHGQYFLNRMKKIVEPEKLDFIVRLFHGRDPRETNPDSRPTIARQLTGLAVTGLAVALLPTIAGFVTQGPASPVPYLLLATGPGKAAAYYLGHKLYLYCVKKEYKLPKHLDESTEFGEYLNGLQQCLFNAIAIFFLV